MAYSASSLTFLNALAVLVYTLLYFIILLHTSTYSVVLYCTQPADESNPKPKKQP